MHLHAVFYNQEGELYDTRIFRGVKTAYTPRVAPLGVESGTEMKFGGRVPYFYAGDEWPRCMACDRAMSFLFQISLPSATDSPFAVQMFRCVAHGEEFVRYLDTMDVWDRTIIPATPPVVYEPFALTWWDQTLEYDGYTVEQALKEIIQRKGFPGDTRVRLTVKGARDAILATVEYEPAADGQIADRIHRGVKAGGFWASCQYSYADQPLRYSTFLQLGTEVFFPSTWGDGGILHLDENLEIDWDTH